MRFIKKLNFQAKGSLLHITLIAGLILLFITTAALTVYYIIYRNHTAITRQEDRFFRILREYDISAHFIDGAESEFERLNRELDRMERLAIGVESWLSVIKRRRYLAQRFPPFRENYLASIKRAREIHPASPPIAAVMAGALIEEGGITPETEEQLRSLLPILNVPAFNSLTLSLHVLLGDFRNPQRASVISPYLPSMGNENISVNFAILRILRSNLRDAAGDIFAILNSPSPSANSIRFAAEYHFDFGDLRQSALLFSLLDDDFSLKRQADALFLAGYQDSARILWTILAASDSLQIAGLSLYNLALTTDDPLEAAVFFEQFINLENESTAASNFKQFGLIRYSRLLDSEQAVSILHNTVNINPSYNPFVDLEICRRQLQYQENRRRIAEAWLLLDRHPGMEELYKWAAWLMAFQREFHELNILLRRLENNEASWIRHFRAIQLMQEGRLVKAEDLLLSIPDEESNWYVFANLGRIMEARRSMGGALEKYEIAAARANSPAAASRIQMSIARCFTALGRASDARLALENAVKLDSENMPARFELERLR